MEPAHLADVLQRGGVDVVVGDVVGVRLTESFDAAAHVLEPMSSRRNAGGLPLETAGIPVPLPPAGV